jgi:hypothetical protein
LDGRKEPLRPARDQEDVCPRGRFLERLEQRVLPDAIDQLRLVNDEDLGVSEHGGLADLRLVVLPANLAADEVLAENVDGDVHELALVQRGVVRIKRQLLADHMQVGVGALFDATSRLAAGIRLNVGPRVRVKHDPGQLHGGRELPDALRARKDPRMVEAPAAEPCPQRLDCLCLAEDSR